MASSTYKLTPQLLGNGSWPINVTEINVADLTTTVLDGLFEASRDMIIGMSAIWGPQCVLQELVFASRYSAIVVRLPSAKKKAQHAHVLARGMILMQDQLLCNVEVKKLVLDAERVTTALFLDHRLRIANVVDMQSSPLSTGSRHSTEALLTCLGGDETVSKPPVLRAFSDGRDQALSEKHGAVHRAWVTWAVTMSESMLHSLGVVSPIDTRTIEKKTLLVLAKLVRNTARLAAMKPTVTKNDINPNVLQKAGRVNVQLTRFNTRLLSGDKRNVVLRSTNKEGKVVNTRTELKEVKGRQVVVVPKTNVKLAGQTVTMYAFGKEEPTAAEQERTAIILNILQGSSTILSSPFAKAILLGRPAVFPSHDASNSSPSAPQDAKLNASQLHAVGRMTSNLAQHTLCLIEGPPGTGKTTVIGRFVIAVMRSLASKRTVWLLAQSNVAVKNIAEKLAELRFLDFKVLVSRDFHFDWHEHLYTEIESKVIRSDDFGKSIVTTERQLEGSRVILCTLSMMSNQRLMEAGFTRCVPVDIVVVDEASQIDVGDYLPLMNKFRSTLRKMIFIGDDKQLPPYGQDDIEDIRSIFEVKSSSLDVSFLDTQYRMPIPIGGFLSAKMYGGRLQSIHKVRANSACKFIDVPEGKEELGGKSWKNVKEADAVIHIARILIGKGHAFKIITPYDAQRAFIENLLKKLNLPWEDKVFCVDSFQGNEEDHIIISVVRTHKIGFLSNRRRSNVMLSRCKQSMYICTHRGYLSNKAKPTLLGELAQQWGHNAWTHWGQVKA